jgi:hypothetical protein
VIASLAARQNELEVTGSNNKVGTCQNQGVEAEGPLKSEVGERGVWLVCIVIAVVNKEAVASKSLALNEEGQ